MTEKKLPLEGQMLAFIDFDAPAPEEGYTRPSDTGEEAIAKLRSKLGTVQKPATPDMLDPIPHV